MENALRKCNALLVAGLLLISTAATAGPNWQSLSFSTSPADAPKLVAELDKLMAAIAMAPDSSAALMANVAGGSTSHSFISSFESRAAREAWASRLLTSDAWTRFAKATSGIVERGSTSRMNFVKSWGEENDKDVFWEIFSFTVTDAAAFTAAIDTLLASETGAKFPGQVHLSSVAAAGMSQSTHLIAVGYESEAEAETWNATMLPSKDWATYMDASQKVGTNTGAFMVRSIKTWSNAGE
jgi:hypothetical protein